MASIPTLPRSQNIIFQWKSTEIHYLYRILCESIKICDISMKINQNKFIWRLQSILIWYRSLITERTRLTTCLNRLRFKFTINLPQNSFSVQYYRIFALGGIENFKINIFISIVCVFMVLCAQKHEWYVIMLNIMEIKKKYFTDFWWFSMIFDDFQHC